MAFNFNWSPLTADAEFYKRARDLLTTALNKSPKPPIIVDDIFVTEFNLGSVPPDLEILEIGDLAEDRFRGIFKMCYSGDAFLTLKTRVQANPLNTYLYSKPTFTSPQPLAAASGLTIPLQITLSDIKLSAFIILVFSKQKGLTLVFRNDPLESLKVSSTFDSIQFVRDYLQRTIEVKLRDLMMDELPAIIHRLSLQLWCPDQIPKEDDVREDSEEAAVNPLETPPLDAVDANGHLLDPAEISSLSLDGGTEMQSLFSQKNLVRLAALTNSHRTLSLFTPGIRDVMVRAWAGPPERPDSHSTPQLTAPSLKSHSYAASGTTYTFSDAGSQDHGHLPSRPSLVSLSSATTGLALGSGRHSKPGRRKKTRVVNLRRKATSEVTSEAGDSTSESASVEGPMSEPVMSSSIPEEPEEELAMPTISTANKVRFTTSADRSPPQPQPRASFAPGAQEAVPPVNSQSPASAQISTNPSRRLFEKSENNRTTTVPLTAKELEAVGQWQRRRPQSDTSSTIQENTWITKMAGEIARRVYELDEKKKQSQGLWDEREDTPPPAYEAS